MSYNDQISNFLLSDDEFDTMDDFFQKQQEEDWQQAEAAITHFLNLAQRGMTTEEDVIEVRKHLNFLGLEV